MGTIATPPPTRGRSSQLVVIVTLVSIAVLVIAGFALASGENEQEPGQAPVVTVDSSIQEQILGVQFQIDEMTSVDMKGAEGAELESYRQQRDFLQSRVDELCGQLDAVTPEVADACG